MKGEKVHAVLTQYSTHITKKKSRDAEFLRPDFEQDHHS